MTEHNDVESTPSACLLRCWAPLTREGGNSTVTLTVKPTLNAAMGAVREGGALSCKRAWMAAWVSLVLENDVAAGGNPQAQVGRGSDVMLSISAHNARVRIHIHQ
jgi:hypothetical protein